MDRRMNVLITGGGGYIAKSIYNALKDKYEVMTISRKDFDLTNKEATDNFFNGRLFDTIIHCAVKGGSRLKEETWEDMDDNLKMYYNLLGNKDHFNKLIHFGSGAEYYTKNTPYGLSKRVIGESMKDKHSFYNLRIFAVFDHNELDTRFIKSNIKRYINKESIRVYENKFMDFMHMADLVKIVDYYINNDNLPKEINCNYESNFKLSDIANIINRLENHTVDIIVEKNSEYEYIAKTYNYLPIDFIGLENGIKQVYKKLKKHEII